MAIKLTLGTRGSDLALYQADLIRLILENEYNCEVHLKIIKTSGDRIDNMSFDKMEGKGFFTKELEDELLNRGIDLAVHSLKDLMTTQPAGLKLGAVGFRADRRELLLIRPESFYGNNILPVKQESIIGTSSARRKCQIASLAPELRITDLHGNIQTRIDKLRNGKYDAIMIAAAGVQRLNLDLSDLKSVILEPDEFFPAPGQGILGIQIREDDPRVGKLISQLQNTNDAVEAAMERGLLAKYNAGCSLPLGVYSKSDRGHLMLQAVLGVCDRNGRWIDLKRVETTGSDVCRIINDTYNKLENLAEKEYV